MVTDQTNSDAFDLRREDRLGIFAAFHETCGALLQQADANRTQSRTLTTLREAILGTPWIPPIPADPKHHHPHTADPRGTSACPNTKS